MFTVSVGRVVHGRFVIGPVCVDNATTWPVFLAALDLSDSEASSVYFSATPIPTSYTPTDGSSRASGGVLTYVPKDSAGPALTASSVVLLDPPDVVSGEVFGDQVDCKVSGGWKGHLFPVQSAPVTAAGTIDTLGGIVCIVATGALALDLESPADPRSHDGEDLTIFDKTGHAHMITCAAGINDGTFNTLTFGGAKGSNVTLTRMNESIDGVQTARWWIKGTPLGVTASLV